MTTAIFALLLVALEVGRNLPAPLKVRKSRSSQGVSPVSSGVLLVAAFVWLFYAVASHAVAAIFASVALLVVVGWWMVELLRAGMQKKPFWLAFSSGTLVLCGVALIDHFNNLEASGLAIMTVAVGLGFGIPRLWVGLSSKSLAGMSGLYLALNLVDATAFGVYGYLIGAWGYVAFGFIQIATSGPVLIRWFLSPQMRQ